MVISAVIFIKIIDLRIKNIVDEYVNIEVERLTNNIVNRAIKEKIANERYNNLLEIKKENNIEKISYNTKEINKITNDITIYIQDKLKDLYNGKIDDYYMLERIKKNKFKKIKRGIICDITIGSIFGSTTFANIGPSIPIKLTFSDQINTSIKIDKKEYGINNVLVEIYLVVKIEEQAIMPITSQKKEILIKEPISIDIIKGNVPNYYGGIIK